MAPLIQLTAIKHKDGVYFTPKWNLKNAIVCSGILTSLIGLAAAAQIQINQIPKNTNQIRNNYKIATEALSMSSGNRVILEALVKKEFDSEQAELIMNQVKITEARAISNIAAWESKDGDK